MKTHFTSKMVASLVGIAMFIAPTASIAATKTTTVMDIPVTKNPIVNKSKTPGITIMQTWVQDNIDPKTSVPIPDRLQLKVKNATSTVISGVEVFYTMTDTVTKASESYYKKLTGFSLPAKKISYIYFDNTSGTGHFSENKYSIYRSSNNEVKFSVELSAKGYAPSYSTAVKAKGTTENPNG